MRPPAPLDARPALLAAGLALGLVVPALTSCGRAAPAPPATVALEAGQAGSGGATAAATGTGPRVLVVRGGVGTTGVDGGPNANDLSDITSRSNRGLDLLTAMLVEEGMSVTQITEGPAPNKAPADLSVLARDLFDVVFFASNNATYLPAQVERVTQFVREGGAVLFTADKNWGDTDTAATDSDQQFLTPFGITMGLDAGFGNDDADDRPTSDAVVSHPILDGVARISGVGVTSYRKSADVPGVVVTGILPSGGVVQDNVEDAPKRPATADDFALLVATSGSGRVACTFDRDTFFNDRLDFPGHDNRAYARNLFRWLAVG